jgi:CRP-like cAMP-binding protein
MERMSDIVDSGQNSLEVFSALSPQIRDQLNKIFHHRVCEKGSHIFEQGMFAKAIYLVKNGRVKISRVTKEGYETILCVRGPGEIFCPVPILDQGDQLGTAMALTDVELFWAEEEIFNDLCQKNPALLSIVQTDCLFEVRRLLHRMEAFAFRSIRERLAFTLLDEIQRQAFHGGSSDELQLKQHELAGLVGASRESVSRTLSEFEDEGILLTHRGHLVILDRERLEKISRA